MARSVMVAYILVDHQLVAAQQGYGYLLLTFAVENEANLPVWQAHEDDKHGFSPK